MSQQTIKQRARRAALDVAARQRRERVERERRIQDLVVQVLTAVGERDEAVADTERRAGAALRDMTDVEGLTLREAMEWCGEEMSVREATRLRKLAGDDGEAGAEHAETNAPADKAACQGGGEVPVRRLDKAGLAVVGMSGSGAPRARGPSRTG